MPHPGLLPGLLKLGKNLGFELNIPGREPGRDVAACPVSKIRVPPHLPLLFSLVKVDLYLLLCVSRLEFWISPPTQCRETSRAPGHSERFTWENQAGKRVVIKGQKGEIWAARAGKIKHSLDSVLLGQKVRPEPKGVGVPSLKPWEQRNTENR